MHNQTPDRDAQYAELRAAHAAREDARLAHHAAVHRFRLAVWEISLTNADLAGELGVVYNTAKDWNDAACRLGETGSATRPRRGKNLTVDEKAERQVAKAATAVESARRNELLASIAPAEGYTDADF